LAPSPLERVGERKTTTNMKVHIIGGGNLGVSIALGLSKFSPENQVTITRRNTSSILYLEKSGATVTTNNTHQIQEADVIILTIKPYQVEAVLARQPLVLRIMKKTKKRLKT